MNCPKCDEHLNTKLIGKVEVDECSRCKGIWFDKDELRKAKDETDPDMNWMDFELWKHSDRFRTIKKPVKCLRCSNEMVAVEYGDTGVTIDYCPKCQGAWLDSKEFENIIDALLNELSSKPFSEYVKTSLHEAKEIATGPEGVISEWKDFTSVIRMLNLRFYVEHPWLLGL